MGPWARYGVALWVVGISSAVSQTIYMITGSERISGPLFAGVLVTSYLAGSGPGYLAAALSYAVYNYYLSEFKFLPVRYSPEDLMLVVIFPVVAALTGSLTGRMRDEAKRADARARASGVLFEATREFAAAHDPDLIRARLADHLASAARGPAFVLDGEVLCATGDPPPPPMVLGAARHFALTAPAGAAPHEAAGWTIQALAGGGLAGWRVDPPLGPDQEGLMQILADAGSVAIARAQLAADRAEAEARARTEDLRNALLSSISHDLRTPLAAVLASASSLQEFGDKFDAKTRHDLTATIQEEAERLNAFVTNLLNMTRLEAGALDPASTAFDLAEVVDRTRKRFERLRGKRKIASQLGVGAGVALGDPVLFEVALANVLENAIRYSPDGGAISLVSFLEGGQVVVQVTDEGPGVPSAELPNLFDKFYRGAAAKRTPGTGLGLSIVRGVMQGMGGQASAVLRTDGPSGLVMSLALPAGQPQILAG
jgi:K+-sensing histidine kinase KdpD